jgi:predicted membrane protein
LFQQIQVLNFLKHAAHSPFLSLQNAVYFIMLPFLVTVLLTFYIQGVLKKFKKFRCQKVNTRHAVLMPHHDHAVLKVTSQDHGTARHGHGMTWHGLRELASAVQ